LLSCVKNLRVEMGYEQIITIMKKKFFEPSWVALLLAFRAIIRLAQGRIIEILQ